MGKGKTDFNNLSIKHIFGMNGDVKQDVQLYDKKTIYYSAAQHFVKFNMEEKTQEFTHSFAQSSSITALCLSNDRR